MSSQNNNPRVPVPEHPFHHKLQLQLRFNDIDMLGHVNNNAYFSYMDLGKADYFRAVMPDDNFDMRTIGVVIANINCDFVAESYMHEPLEVQTQTASIGERSLRMEQRVVNASTGQVKCISHTVMVSFDPKTRQSAPISEKWRNALSSFEQRQL